jgi:hypothetical protein
LLATKMSQPDGVRWLAFGFTIGATESTHSRSDGCEKRRVPGGRNRPSSLNPSFPRLLAECKIKLFRAGSVEMVCLSTLKLRLAVLYLWAISALAQTSSPSTNALANSNTAVRLPTTPSTSSTPTNWIGPLTTVFTPPASCLTNEAITTANVNSTQSPFYSTQSLFNNGPSGAQMVRSECFPSKYPHTEFSYYSPGICPSGWGLNSAPSIQQRFAPSTSSEETVGICCPSRYTYVDGPVGCTSYLAQTTSGSVLNPSFFVQFGHGIQYGVIQTLMASDATVTINATITSTVTTGAVFSSSQVPPISGQRTTFSVTQVSPTTYLTTYNILTYTDIFTVISAPTTSTVSISLHTSTATILSDITYSEITASPVYTTNNIAPGEVWASGIQIRWTGSYPPNVSRSLTPGQKAGISFGVIAGLALIACIVIWVIRRHRFGKRRFNASQGPVLDAGVEESQLRELPETPFITEHVLPPPARLMGAQEVRDESASRGRHLNLGGPILQPPVTPAADSSVAEIGSITSVKRKPVQPNTMESQASHLDTENQPDSHHPAIELGTIGVPPASSKGPFPPTVSVLKVPSSRTEEQPEQASIAALSSTGEGSTSSRRETLSEGVEEEGLRAELARIVEKKQRVKEMQRLKEVEENLEKREEELLERLKARGAIANT